MTSGGESEKTSEGVRHSGGRTAGVQAHSSYDHSRGRATEGEPPRFGDVRFVERHFELLMRASLRGVIAGNEADACRCRSSYRAGSVVGDAFQKS